MNAATDKAKGQAARKPPQKAESKFSLKGTGLSKVHVVMSQELHINAKVYAARHQMTMRDLINEGLEERLKKGR